MSRIRLIFLFVFLLPLIASGQKDEIRELEKGINDLFGKDKVEALNLIAAHYLDDNPKRAVRYGKSAVALADRISNPSDSELVNQHIRAYNLLGMAYYKQEKYYDSYQTFESAKNLAEVYNIPPASVIPQDYVRQLDSIIEVSGDLEPSFLTKSLRSIQLGKAISNTSLDLNIATAIKLGDSHTKSEKYDKALEQYQKALDLLRNTGNVERINEVHQKIAGIYRIQGNDSGAIAYLDEQIRERQKEADSIASTRVEAPLLSATGDDVQDTTLVLDEEADIPAEEILSEQSENYKELAEQFAANQDYEKALEYQTLSAQYEGELQKRQLAEAELTMLRQQKQIAELDLQNKEAEVEKEARAKNNLFVGSGMLLALAAALMLMYATKRKDHRKLTVAFRNLNKTKEQLSKAERRIKKLLGQQVSGDIAQELISAKTDKSLKKFVCIMFLDIRGFTPMAEKLEPEELISYQNKVFGFMIDIIQKNHGIINQLLGDGFMATFGAPVSKGNDCQNAFNSAVEIISRANELSTKGSIQSTRVGIGLHAGHVVAGNVGTDQRKQYSITGNTVIVASRLEQLNKEFGSQLVISKQVHTKLDNYQGNVDFKEVNIKGRSNPIKVLAVM